MLTKAVYLFFVLVVFLGALYPPNASTVSACEPPTGVISEFFSGHKTSSSNNIDGSNSSCNNGNYGLIEFIKRILWNLLGFGDAEDENDIFCNSYQASESEWSDASETPQEETSPPKGILKNSHSFDKRKTVRFGLQRNDIFTIPSREDLGLVSQCRTTETTKEAERVWMELFEEARKDVLGWEKGKIVRLQTPSRSDTMKLKAFEYMEHELRFQPCQSEHIYMETAGVLSILKPESVIKLSRTRYLVNRLLPLHQLNKSIRLFFLRSQINVTNTLLESQLKEMGVWGNRLKRNLPTPPNLAHDQAHIPIAMMKYYESIADTIARYTTILNRRRAVHVFYDINNATSWVISTIERRLRRLVAQELITLGRELYAGIVQEVRELVPFEKSTMQPAFSADIAYLTLDHMQKMKDEARRSSYQAEYVDLPIEMETFYGMLVRKFVAPIEKGSSIVTVDAAIMTAVFMIDKNLEVERLDESVMSLQALSHDLQNKTEIEKQQVLEPRLETLNEKIDVIGLRTGISVVENAIAIDMGRNWQESHLPRSEDSRSVLRSSEKIAYQNLLIAHSIVFATHYFAELILYFGAP